MSLISPPGQKSNALKEATVQTLKKEDLDREEALKLLTAKDVEDLGLTVGQKRLLAAALKTLHTQTGGVDVPEPVTTKSLAKDGGLDEILALDGGATDSTFIQDFLLSVVLRKFPRQPHLSHKKASHAPVVNRKLATLRLFVGNSIP